MLGIGDEHTKLLCFTELLSRIQFVSVYSTEAFECIVWLILDDCAFSYMNII